MLVKICTDVGEANFAFKDFTVNHREGNNASTLAAEASYCAAEQYKYWQYMMRYLEVLRNE